MDDKVPVIPLEIMGDDVDLTCVFEGSRYPAIRENLANNVLLKSEWVEGRLGFRPQSDWPRAVLGVA